MLQILQISERRSWESCLTSTASLSVHLLGTPTATQKGAEPTGTASLKTSKVCAEGAR